MIVETRHALSLLILTNQIKPDLSYIQKELILYG
jgi:hypothetical protein